MDAHVSSIPRDTEDIISTTIACATWLVRADHLDLAIALRNDFLNEWGFDHAEWNHGVAKLIDYVERKGDTPAISIPQLRAVMYL